MGALRVSTECCGDRGYQSGTFRTKGQRDVHSCFYHHCSCYDSRDFKRYPLLYFWTEKVSWQTSEKREKDKKALGRIGVYATIAMFIGLCSAYIGSYVGTWTAYKNYLPLFVAGISALAMAVFEYLISKKKMECLENFSVAASMIIGMTAAVLVSL